MTQQRLAELSGLNLRYISQIENGALNLTIDTLAALAGGLGVEAAVLMATDAGRSESVESAAGKKIEVADHEVPGLERAREIISTYLGDKKNGRANGTQGRSRRA